MDYIGISCGFHDASLCVVDSTGNIQFAAHSERYSGVKNDATLCSEIITDAMNYVTNRTEFHYYERPLLKYFRQVRSGQTPSMSRARAHGVIGSENLRLLGASQLSRIHTHGHHLSHAAAGFQTSPFERATVVIIDAIGEWDTVTIWAAEYNSEGRAKYRLLWKQTYPDSIGLFYSAMTQRVGLKPNEEEYIMMGMAAWTQGNVRCTDDLKAYAIDSTHKITFNENYHCGIDSSVLYNYTDLEIANSTQHITEQLIHSVLKRAAEYGYSENLVYGGGVALNCLANRNLGNFFENIWIMPNPGDSGSSLGAAALGYGKRLNWTSPYLGSNIPGDYPVTETLATLLQTGIAGVASGRTEFGPRALGNRSLLADPRGTDIKQRVNSIKQRQQFRPFAPVILAEHVNQYFDLPRGFGLSPYMQTVARCKHPERYPAIIHCDNTSRVQTVAPDSDSGIRRLLEAWYNKTGCPMLLNTSLNIRGEPMVNTVSDAKRFSDLYNIPVYS
jgi:carbamoyltransferase